MAKRTSKGPKLSRRVKPTASVIAKNLVKEIDRNLSSGRTVRDRARGVKNRWIESQQ